MKLMYIEDSPRKELTRVAKWSTCRYSISLHNLVPRVLREVDQIVGALISEKPGFTNAQWWRTFSSES